MRLGTERRLATVHRLRPRVAAECADPRAAGRDSGSAPPNNVIDLSGARRRRRPLHHFDIPPEGTAA